MTRTKIVAFSFCFSVFYCSSIYCNRHATAAELERLNVVDSTIASALSRPGCRWQRGFIRSMAWMSSIYVAGSQAITTLISGDAQIAQASGAAGVFSALQAPM